MALPTKKIPELTAYGTSLQGSEMLEIWAAGTSRRITARDFVLPNVDSIITAVNQVAVLPKSRFIAAGTGIAIADSGAGNALTISMLGTGALPGNPTAQVGLTPVNGVATTWMRSDAAPQLDQSISPSWSGVHTFTSAGSGFNSGLVSSSTSPTWFINETDAAADNRAWRLRATAEQFRLEVVNDAVSAANTALLIDRTGTAVDSVSLQTTGSVNLTVGSALVGTTNINGATTGQFVVSDVNPSYYIIETDAPANEQVWRLNAANGDLIWSTRTDANAGAGATFFSVTRTGTTVDLITATATAITLAASTGTANGLWTFSSAGSALAWPINLDSNQPGMLLREADGAVDNRIWRWFVAGEQMRFDVTTDAGTNASWATIDRTSNAIDSIVFLSSATTLTIGANVTSTTTMQSPAHNLSSVSPALRWIETDAGANEQIWDAITNGGDIFFRTRTDVDGAGNTWLTAVRTGTTVDLIALSATALSVTGTTTFVTAQSGPTAYPVLLSSATPALGFNETDAAANNRLWDIVANGEQWVRRVLSDAGAAVNFEVVDRTANVVDQIGWTATSFIFTGILTRPTISQLRETLNTQSWGAGAQTLDLNNGGLHKVTLTGNVTLSFSNPPPNSNLGHTFTMFIIQDATGSRTITWPASVHWDSGTTPVLTTTPSRLDAVTLTTYDGGTTYYGGQVLANVVP